VPDSELPDALQAAAQREEERVAAEILDAQIKIVTATYSQAAAYTNLVLLGGYAGFFGLWQLTKEYLARTQILCSALLILVSLLFFVLFEVAKMILVTKSTLRKAKVLESVDATSTPATTLAALREVESSLELSVGPFMRFWGVSVFVSLVTALLAAGILAYAFVAELLSGA
jgi:hypothetical protein